jgi:hypothetical protein
LKNIRSVEAKFYQPVGDGCLSQQPLSLLTDAEKLIWNMGDGKMGRSKPLLVGLEVETAKRCLDRNVSTKRTLEVANWPRYQKISRGL